MRRTSLLTSLLLLAGCAGSSSTPAPAPVKVEPTRKVTQPTAKEDKAAKLKKADDEIMGLFRAGKKQEGIDKLSSLLKPYKGIAPSERSPEESMQVAILYTRFCALVVNVYSEDDMIKLIDWKNAWAKHGGVEEGKLANWSKGLSMETSATVFANDPANKPK